MGLNERSVAFPYSSRQLLPRASPPSAVRPATRPYEHEVTANLQDTVSEWLRRRTRNPLGSARKGNHFILPTMNFSTGGSAASFIYISARVALLWTAASTLGARSVTPHHAATTLPALARSVLRAPESTG